MIATKEKLRNDYSFKFYWTFQVVLEDECLLTDVFLSILHLLLLLRLISFSFSYIINKI